MKFSPTPIPGAMLIEIEPIEDERGFFSRTVCAQEFAQYGLNAEFVQQSLSVNRRAGTLRGLHFQCAPNPEDKLVQVMQGAIFDVIVDLRRNSSCFGEWFAIELSAYSHQQLYVPAGVAHGFQTLQADTQILYQMTAPFDASASRGVRWDDHALGIHWPKCTTRLISERDQHLPLVHEWLHVERQLYDAQPAFSAVR